MRTLVDVLCFIAGVLLKENSDLHTDIDVFHDIGARDRFEDYASEA